MVRDLLTVSTCNEACTRSSIAGNCKVDADCGASGYCSPSPSVGCTLDVAGYFCHTPGDECVDDTDCGKDGTGPGVCSYDKGKAHWACSPLVACA